jgi:hypothetical protein
MSHYWLLRAAISEDAACQKTQPESMPVAQPRPQVKQLLMMRSAKGGISAAVVKDRLKDVPASWLLGKRTIILINEVQLTWDLDVGELRDTARHCAAERKARGMCSPGTTPPLGGMDFKLMAGL